METVTIGVLIDSDLEYSVEVLEGVRDYCRPLPEWRVLPLTNMPDALLARLVRSGEIQGLAGSVISDRWLADRFPPAFPIVNTSNLSHISAVCSVVPDDAEAGKLVARHFRELNVSRTAVITDRAVYAARLRREGFLAGMAEYGLAVCEPAGIDAFRQESGWGTWMASLAGETAVFCTSDALARRLHLLCRRLPAETVRNLSQLAGVGDSLTERMVSGVDLTSVALPARSVGLRAAARLARLLAGDCGIVRETVPTDALVVRESTARYASDDEVVSRAMGLALQTLAQNLGVDEWARRTGVSRRTLEGRFRRVFGHGPAQEMRTRKLTLARRLLAETDLAVAEIAARCGGGSVQAFTTLFRKICGCPPAAYRRTVRLDGRRGRPASADNVASGINRLAEKRVSRL